jgi:hypothetical protein
MDSTKLIELLSYTFPAIITGLVAYYFFNLHTKNEEGRRRYLLNKDAQKDALPLRLQAFERMTLFLERINPGKLLIRISPNSENKNDYENLLISTIEQEFEHNLTQQIYMSEECLTVIIKAKNATIQMIRRTNRTDGVNTANNLREVIMNDLMDKQSPSIVALSYIKNEVQYLF